MVSFTTPEPPPPTTTQQNGFIVPPRNVAKKGGRSLRNLNPRKALRVIITNSQNKENGQGSVTYSSSRVQTGMEKDEEKELHLQVAIQTQKASLNGTLKNASAIPIPRVDIVDQTEYHRHRHKRIRIRHDQKWIKAVEKFHYSMQADSYEIDEEDFDWIKQQETESQLPVSIDEFEAIISMLEIASTKSVVSMAAIFIKLPQMDRKFLSIVYDYWLEKRLRFCQSTFPNASLIPTIPSEPDFEDKNPYVAFRKRDVDIRRRSVRLAFHQALLASQQDQPRHRNPEEIAIEREEELERLRFDVLRPSDLDGRFAFKRQRQCAYKRPGTGNDLITLNMHDMVMLPQKEKYSMTFKSSEQLSSEPARKKRKTEQDETNSILELYAHNRFRALLSVILEPIVPEPSKNNNNSDTNLLPTHPLSQPTMPKIDEG